METALVGKNFNSIKVRLELTQSAISQHIKAHFNSIKVRLELILSVLLGINLLYFNSIKVRLEPNIQAAPTAQGNFNSIKVRLERRWTKT